MDELSCPRVPWLQPAETKGRLARARRRLSPKSWATKEFRLFFVCPVTCAKAETNDGKGYPITLLRDWVVKYGPALKLGVQVLKIALAAGRIAGLPLPGLPEMPELINQAEKEAVAQLEAVMNAAMGKLQGTVGEEWADVITEHASELAGQDKTELEAAMELDAEPVPGVQAEKAKQVRGASFRALKALVEKQDPQLQRTGLAKVQSPADHSVEWVSEQGRARFEKLGQRSLLAVACE